MSATVFWQAAVHSLDALLPQAGVSPTIATTESRTSAPAALRTTHPLLGDGRSIAMLVPLRVAAALPPVARIRSQQEDRQRIWVHIPASRTPTIRPVQDAALGCPPSR
jgi:hypothetical protein